MFLINWLIILSFFVAVKYTQRFLSQSYIRMIFTSKVNLPWKFSLRFRTAVPSGTLVETSFKSSVSSLLEVSSELGRKKEAGKKLVGHFDFISLASPKCAVCRISTAFASYYCGLG